MSASFQLPNNALAIKVMQVRRGKLIFSPEGNIADETNGDVLVSVTTSGLQITLQGARVIMSNMVELELSHREFAIIKDMIKPKRAKPTPEASTGGALAETGSELATEISDELVGTND